MKIFNKNLHLFTINKPSLVPIVSHCLFELDKGVYQYLYFILLTPCTFYTVFCHDNLNLATKSQKNLLLSL